MANSKSEDDSGTFIPLSGFRTKNVIFILMVIIGGGGGVAALDFCTDTEVRQYIQEAKEIEDVRHEAIDQKFERQDLRITDLQTGIKRVQTTQIREIARQEARRLTFELKDRKLRESNYDRLLLKNIQRLESGKDPCTNLACNNP